MCRKEAKVDEIVLLLNLLQNYAAKRKNMPSADSVIRTPIKELEISAAPPSRQGRAAEALDPPPAKKTEEVVVLPQQERDTSDRCLMSTIYQTKFEQFQKECLPAANELQKRFLEAKIFAGQLSELQKCIYALLKQQNLIAASNFDQACKRSPNAMASFCQFVISNDKPNEWGEAQWKLLADFVKRMAIDAPGATAISVLQAIMAELMKELNGFMPENLEVEGLQDQVNMVINNFFRAYRLQDSSNPGEKLSLANGIDNYIRERILQISYEALFPQAANVTDVRTYAVQQLESHFKDIKEEAAIKLLMSSAPGSIWEVKCLQAGISRFKWGRANS